MNKITIVIPKKKGKRLEKLLKAEGLNKFIRMVAGRYYKYEVFITELKTQEALDKIKQELKIHAGKSVSEGYVTVHTTNIVAPYIQEKGKELELEALIMKDAKRFIKLDRNYLLFTILGAIIAAIGFQLDNMIIIIGSMLITPLMSPVMAVSYGLLRSNKTLILKGLKSELTGIALIMVTALLLSPVPNVIGLESTLTTLNPLLITLLSIVIGAVAAVSFITGSQETLTGVAVSISLIPPLVNSMLLLPLGRLELTGASLITFAQNILGMHLSALITFYLLIRK